MVSLLFVVVDCCWLLLTLFVVACRELLSVVFFVRRGCPLFVVVCCCWCWCCCGLTVFVVVGCDCSRLFSSLLVVVGYCWLSLYRCVVLAFRCCLLLLLVAVARICCFAVLSQLVAGVLCRF